MERPNEYDKLGFPVPATFEEQKPRQPRARRIGVFWPLLGLVFVVTLIFYGPGGAAMFFTWRAEERAQQGDFGGAVGDLGTAIYWTENAPQGKPVPELYEFRARLRLMADPSEKSVAAAISDLEVVIRLAPGKPAPLSELANALMRLSFHRPQSADALHERALRLCDQVVELAAPIAPSPRNSRAYVRAVAGKELEAGMQDVEQAILLLEQLQGLDGPVAEAGIEYRSQRAAFLDTRGYLFHLLGDDRQGLADMHEAIKLQTEVSAAELASARGEGVSQARFKIVERMHNEIRAVMLYHRGVIYEKLGRTEEAEADLFEAKKLGYDPLKGVF